MRKIKLITLTIMAMLAFAGNSLLCLAALKSSDIDATSFTAIRLVSGALTLWLLISFRYYYQSSTRVTSNASNKARLTKQKVIFTKENYIEHWYPAALLFTYAAGFSFAYISLSTATGALLLFGAVQISMLGYALFQGERFSLLQTLGLITALGGVIALLSPGATQPPIFESVLMIIAGIAWGAYSVHGKSALDPIKATTRNFIFTVPFVCILVLLTIDQISLDTQGMLYALVSGSIASGLGYAIWYYTLPNLTATNAATLQLSVPVISALGGTLLLQEHITSRLILTSIIILGGIAMVITQQRKQQRKTP